MGSTRPHAIVIGGSVGGLAAAGLLRSIGWRATVFERTIGDLAGRGAGLGISAELLQVMDRIGAPLEVSAGAAHKGYVWMDADGRVVFRHDRETVGSTWARVYRPLRDNIPDDDYRQGMTLERVEQDAGAVTAIFSDGTRVAAEMLVAADGVFSTVRAQFLPEIEPHYSNYVAWRGLVGEQEVSGSVIDALANRLVFCFPDNEMLLAMTAPGEGEDMRPGHRRIYFIWYRPAAPGALAALFTDADGRNHGVSIPPPLIRDELVRDMKARAREKFAPAISEVVNTVSRPMLQAITDMESPRLSFGRVAVMGDAAFVARPHTAGGVSKAALDAQCLVDSLVGAKHDVGAALARYDRTQQAFGRRLVAHSRYLGAFLEDHDDTPRRSGRAEPERDPERIILDYGAPDMLHDVDPDRFREGRSAVSPLEKKESKPWQPG